MGEPYPIVIEIDGRRCGGWWSLRQGGVVHVGSGFGVRSAEVGRRRPEIVAAEVLRRLVAADVKARRPVQEMKINGRRQPRQKAEATP